VEKNKNTIDISQLSEHLFGDVDKDTLDTQKNKRLIIQRVLDYGLMQDWQTIKDMAG
jgi:hypothetical protein